ncbi:DUF5134 domain-containing protein [Streptomyces sp. NPDC058293]|uniref:DUF5134 domain-containing protein n=1 Tax=Streptomyces sp. NPDC058293 TaxID=3346429 RepID=UPI0036E8CAF4
MTSMRTPVDVEHSLLTVLFSVVAVHALWQVLRLGGIAGRDRVDHLLHAAMAAAMAVMPWSVGHSLSGGTATLFFTAAALWFPLTAFDGRPAHAVAAIAARLPSAVGMAAMAWMLSPSHGRDPVVTALLTSYLLACALWSLTRPMPSLRSATDHAHGAAATDPYGPTRHGAMALGTALMLLMHH